MNSREMGSRWEMPFKVRRCNRKLTNCTSEATAESGFHVRKSDISHPLPMKYLEDSIFNSIQCTMPSATFECTEYELYKFLPRRNTPSHRESSENLTSSPLEATVSSGLLGSIWWVREGAFRSASFPHVRLQQYLFSRTGRVQFCQDRNAIT
jgi:hypothetical protein